MTKDDFIRLAQPQPFTLAGQPLAAQPVFTGQGSCGWLWQGALYVPVGDAVVQALATVRLTSLLSRKWATGVGP